MTRSGWAACSGPHAAQPASAPHQLHWTGGSNPRYLAATMASTLELDQPPGETASATLTRYLRNKHILLVVDNFEQVLEAASLLTDLLSAAPGLKLLVTSREALGVYGETVYPVAPLVLPDLDQAEWASSAGETESVALFVQGAQCSTGNRIVRPGCSLMPWKFTASWAIRGTLPGRWLRSASPGSAADQPVIERYAAAVRRQLGEAEFELERAKGRAMELKDAVDYALAASPAAT